MTTAAQRWRDDLQAWAIPEPILAAAPTSPWIHPVSMFVAPENVIDSPSHDRAREVMPDAGSVLDVGCGGGRAARALVPPAALVVGVDPVQDMLERFAVMAEMHGVAHREIAGRWPDVASLAPVADVVVCHHVAYNVADLAPFLHALDQHARRRVVLELPARHPLTQLAPLWELFWGISRPTRPQADDVVAIACEAGIDAAIESWVEPPASRPVLDAGQRATLATIQLCLPPDREPEVAAALAAAGPSPPRLLATIWWDARQTG